MPMNDMRDFEAIDPNIADALKLVSQSVGIAAQLAFPMREDPIAGALADIRGFAVARIDEPVDVIFETVGDFLGENRIPPFVQSPAPSCRSPPPSPAEPQSSSRYSPPPLPPPAA
jgi:hypothetical protein